MPKKLVIVAVVLALLAGAGTITWELLEMPPLRLVLKYGYPSPMGPTGRTLTLEGIEFVEISPGYFRMGSHFLCEKGDLLGRVSALVGLEWGKPPKHYTECPQHYGEFAAGFWISRYEVTNMQYERFRPANKREVRSPGDRHPVVNVSWDDARAFCRRLGEETGMSVRLPSEAEWECGCRAGSETEYSFGDDTENLVLYAWCLENQQGSAQKVGTRMPNAWGLHDLHGSVSEWCTDGFHANYSGAPGDGSAWTSNCIEQDMGGPYRVFRGGSWIQSGFWSRSAGREWLPATDRSPIRGFRPAFSVNSARVR